MTPVDVPVTRPPRIAVILPRAMHFGPEQASSIDLCVHDFVMHSAFRETTTVFADWIATPYENFNVALVPEWYSRRHLTRYFWLWRKIRDFRADIIVVQQHLPTAAILARFLPRTPILLHAHNFLKTRADHGDQLGDNDPRLAQLAGLICVSETVKAAFHESFPEQHVPAWTVHNGLDMAAWTPSTDREKTVLMIARAAPFKGVMEALDAMLAVLPRHPDWRGKLMLSDAEQPGFSSMIKERLVAANNPNIELRWQQPFATVKRATERAAIALVPSIWTEPYGRTAIESHAGGAALISSGRGGLSEVSGNCALYIDEVNAETLGRAIEALIRDEARRRELAVAGRQRAEQFFDMRIVAARLDDVYRRMTARQEGAP